MLRQMEFPEMMAMGSPRTAFLPALDKYPMGEVTLMKRKTEAEESKDKKGGRRQVGVQKKSSTCFSF